MQLVRETGKPITEVARELGINARTLRNWVNADHRRHSGGSGPSSEAGLETLARVRFRDLDPEARAEAVQNTAALAWKYWLGVAARGRDGEPGMLRNIWWFACKQTRAGRTIARDLGRAGLPTTGDEMPSA